jgi:hypothetical protein
MEMFKMRIRTYLSPMLAAIQHSGGVFEEYEKSKWQRAALDDI